MRPNAERRLVCLQELFRSQYFCQTEDIQLFKLAETIPGPTTEALGKVARRAQGGDRHVAIRKRAAGVYHNTAVMIDDVGKIAGKYRKMHIPDDPLYYEKFYFTPGDLGFQTHDTAYGRWDAGLLGPVVSGSSATDRARWRAVSVLPDGHWLATRRREMNEAQHSAWGNYSARACDRQRCLRRGG